MADQLPRRAQLPPSDDTSTGDKPSRRLWILALAALLVLALGYSVFRAVRGGGNTPASDGSASPAASQDAASNSADSNSAASQGAASQSASSGASSDGCSTPIAVDPSWVQAINAAVASYPKKGNGGCPAVQAVATPDAQVVKQGLGQAKGWIPEDPAVVAGNAHLAQSTPTVVGSTPIVLVAQQQVKDALGSRSLSGPTLAALASGQKNWNDFGRNWGPLRLVVPNPSTSVAGAAGFQTIAATVAGGGTPTSDASAIQSHMAQMAQVQYHVAQTVTTPDDVLKHLGAVASDDTGRGPAGPRVGVTTEYALLAAKPAAHTVAATPLAGGATGVQMSVVNPAGDQSVKDFTTWLMSSAGQKALANAGVTTRGATPSADKLAAVGLPATMPTPVASNAAASLGQARQLYQGFSTRMATTTVIDASGSMGEYLPGSQTRKIDLVTQAAAGTWQQWPDGSASAVITFNTVGDSTAPNIRVVVPWIVAGQPGSAAKMSQYSRAMQWIPVYGGTPLFQAVDSALRYAQQHYTPGKINQVVVVTDGHDQDARENITLDQLVAKIQAADRSKPIKMRYVALGPDADYATLKNLASRTGGTAAWAQTAENLPSVLQQLMAS